MGSAPQSSVDRPPRRTTAPVNDQLIQPDGDEQQRLLQQSAAAQQALLDSEQQLQDYRHRQREAFLLRSGQGGAAVHSASGGRSSSPTASTADGVTSVRGSSTACYFASPSHVPTSPIIPGTVTRARAAAPLASSKSAAWDVGVSRPTEVQSADSSRRPGSSRGVVPRPRQSCERDMIRASSEARAAGAGWLSSGGAFSSSPSSVGSACSPQESDGRATAVQPSKNVTNCPTGGSQSYTKDTVSIKSPSANTAAPPSWAAARQSSPGASSKSKQAVVSSIMGSNSRYVSTLAQDGTLPRGASSYARPVAPSPLAVLRTSGSTESASGDARGESLPNLSLRAPSRAVPVAPAVPGPSRVQQLDRPILDETADDQLIAELLQAELEQQATSTTRGPAAEVDEASAATIARILQAEEDDAVAGGDGATSPGLRPPDAVFAERLVPHSPPSEPLVSFGANSTPPAGRTGGIVSSALSMFFGDRRSGESGVTPTGDSQPEQRTSPPTQRSTIDDDFEMARKIQEDEFLR